MLHGLPRRERPLWLFGNEKMPSPISATLTEQGEMAISTPPDQPDAALQKTGHTGELIAGVSERLLIERLHRLLDESGSAALLNVSQTLLPHFHALLELLPHLLSSTQAETAPAAVRSIGLILQEQGVDLTRIMSEGLELYERLLQEMGAHQRPENPWVGSAETAAFHRTLLTLGSEAVLAYVNQQTATLAQLAHTDSLTGLSNRRYFDQRLDEEIQRAKRSLRPLALALLDADGLKMINDSFGHAVGDQMLQVIAIELQRQSRSIDVTSRIGGDEFALLLPETSHDGALTLMTRLEHGIADHRIRDQAVRCSWGIAVYPDDGDSARQLMRYADAALYRAKNLRGADAPSL